MPSLRIVLKKLAKLTERCRRLTIVLRRYKELGDVTIAQTANDIHKVRPRSTRVRRRSDFLHFEQFFLSSGKCLLQNGDGAIFVKSAEKVKYIREIKNGVAEICNTILSYFIYLSSVLPIQPFERAGGFLLRRKFRLRAFRMFRR